jgi:hypothetical protein
MRECWPRVNKIHKAANNLSAGAKDHHIFAMEAFDAAAPLTEIIAKPLFKAWGITL